MSAPEITANGNRIRVSGGLTVATARALFEQTPRIDAAAGGGGEVHIDLTAVGEADSAGLALLLHWAQRIEAASAKVVFEGAPEQVRRMAEIGKLGDLFGASS